MKRAVVTGGAGFIGSHLVDSLLDDGFEVLVVDDLSTGNIENLSEARSRGGSRLTLVTAGVGSKEAAQALAGFAPTVVFHLAAQMNVRRSVDDPAFDADSNVVGTVAMLEAARRCGTRDFIFASTGGAIYGEQDYFPADEAHPIRPKSPYGVGKRAGELYLEYYASFCGMRCSALRFANVYGPRQNPKGEAGVVAIFAERLLTGDTLRVNGDGEQTRDFIFVGDVVRACLLAMKQPKDGLRVFNVGLGRETSVNQIVDLLSAAWRASAAPGARQSAVEHGPALAGEQMRSVISSRKLSDELRWRPETELAEGLALTLRSFHPSR